MGLKLEMIKYIGICDERILTHQGYKKLDKLNNGTIRLFNSEHDLRKYVDEKLFRRSYATNTVAKKIKVTYEEVE